MGTCVMSETKSTNGANCPQAVCFLVSHTLTTPSSSPEATVFASMEMMRFTAALCALVKRANGLLVATSVARMLRSDEPVRSNAPSLTNASVRHAASWHRTVFSLRAASRAASRSQTSTSPVIRPATKIWLFGWKPTSKGCSAHRAEHSSPPSIGVVASDEMWRRSSRRRREM